ncbi:MAG: SCO family protein [Bacteroidota bacterium]
MLTTIVMNKNILSFTLIIVVSSLLSCSKDQGNKEVDVKTFPLKGEVVKIDREKHRVMIAHEEIPNYMAAMTMPFKVKDTTLLDVAQPGDSVQGLLAVSRTESWIASLTLLGKGEVPDQAAEQALLLSKLFKEGEPLPDVVYTNQNGNNLRLNKYRGQVVALTFIYTRCPLPDFCIRMSSSFAKVQKALARDASLRNKWHLVSISFDPKFDSPKVLRSYGQTYTSDFATWDFVTTSEQSLAKLAEGLDLYVQPGEGGLIDHTLRTVLLDQDGRLVKVIKGNDWTPEDLANDIRGLIKDHSVNHEGH